MQLYDAQGQRLYLTADRDIAAWNAKIDEMGLAFISDGRRKTEPRVTTSEEDEADEAVAREARRQQETSDE